MEKAFLSAVLCARGDVRVCRRDGGLVWSGAAWPSRPMWCVTVLVEATPVFGGADDLEKMTVFTEIVEFNDEGQMVQAMIVGMR